MVIYFSATGNSQYAAEAIADRLNDKVICANDIIKQRKTGSFKSSRPWVFVFPVYLSTIPEIFARFIKSSHFKGNNTAYFAATCAASMGSSPNVCAEICRLKQWEYKGTALIQMPQNYIALFTMHDQNECERRLASALNVADEISNAVKENSTIETKFAGKAEYAATMLVERLYNKYFTRTKNFYATDECVGCGVCVKLCPINNISLSDGKPKWTGNCIHCMACINRCPKAAIEYGKNTVGKTRYVCKRYKKDDH